MSIYVETRIRGDSETLWERTQVPDLHEQWDLRFTSITYLPRPDDRQPQRFRYATRIGLGLEIQGAGETVGQRDAADGQRASALKFWSNDPRSLIHEGSGYWKYIPTDDGIRFLTGYDYRVRFGLLGRLVDRLVFRPLMGWATAWSFDRLRLWIERGTSPATSRRIAVTYTLLRILVAFVWLYHGLVPKILVRHPSELELIARSGIGMDHAATWAMIVGVAELTLAGVILLWWRSRWPLVLTAVLMAAALLAAAATSPGVLTAAFNPVTLNLLVIGACVGAALLLPDIPSARRCMRRAPKEDT